MADDGVDSNKSMEDEEVDLYRSMDADFMKFIGARKFSFDDLVNATNSFSEQQKLGMGGFGAVYRGFMKQLNCHVAVKKVSRDSRQGIKEYASEVKIISQLRHRNIVQLMGWCHERRELLLVYEFMANGSLDCHLFKENSFLTWEVRYKIARGLASGLLYLHEEWEQYVVHRDIKASNVMLDSNFNAKIGDFGLARLGDHGKGLDNTTLAGTIGYVAPEYAASGRASKESDVYSFGIVALEIACGRQVIDRKARRVDLINLREWVWNLYGEGKLLEAADSRLNGEFDKQQAECLMIVGLWCAHPDANSRPTIEKAIHVLNFVAPLPNLPSKMPMATYLAPFSMSSGDTDLVGSKKQSRTVAERGFGAPHKGFLRELNFGLWKRNKGKKEDKDFEVSSGMFSYKDLVRATNHFSEQTKLGEGRFGTVYKGFLMELNSYVAVKWISSEGCGLVMKRYESKIKILNRLRHKNIVQFIGSCNSEIEVFLISEFMPNECLGSYLFREDKFLTWEMRYKIAKGSASGLLYLHEECKRCMVHGNITSSNVVLDFDFNAKLGDFGLAMLMGHGDFPVITGLKTIGYMAPECVITCKASRESDMYSFGIVALEIACGRKPIDSKACGDQLLLVEWLWDMYGKGKLLEAVDPRLNGDFDEQQVKCLMVIGLWCTHPDPKMRPSVRQATQVLNYEAPLPTLPPKMPAPTYFASSLPRSMGGSDLEESQNQSSFGEISETEILIGR